MYSGADKGLHPQRIYRQIESSLERLGVEYLDMYLTHEMDKDVPIEDTLNALYQLQVKGKIKAFGASNIKKEELEHSLKVSKDLGIGRYEWVQISRSLLFREDTVLDCCTKNGLGFTTYSPLAGGWLTGKYKKGEPYTEGSRMALIPSYYLKLVNDKIFDSLNGMRTLCKERFGNITMAGLSLGWLLGDPRVTAIIIGPKMVEHLDPVKEALQLHLTETIVLIWRICFR
jgi:aryl-alcohol dehydrogenase-like predicted oxidoreductase